MKTFTINSDVLERIIYDSIGTVGHKLGVTIDGNLVDKIISREIKKLNKVNKILETKIERCIIDWEVLTISDIMFFLELPKEQRSEVNSIVNQLCLKNQWLIITQAGKIFVSSMMIANVQLKAIIRKHKNGVIEKAIPKTLPMAGDWVVTSVDTPTKFFYYDKIISRDIARYSFAKLNSVKFVDTRIKIVK